MTVETVSRPKAPPCPSDLGTVGKKFWRTFFRSPVAAAVADVDLMVVERLCTIYDRLANPELADKDYATLAGTAIRIETALGITAASRARLGIKLDAPSKPTLASVRDALGA